MSSSSDIFPSLFNHSEIKYYPSFEIVSKFASPKDSNDSKPKSSHNSTSSHDIFEYSEEFPIISLEHKQDSCESCNFDIDHHLSYEALEDDSDIDHHFSYQLLEDDPKTEISDIQSSKIVGSICK